MRRLAIIIFILFLGCWNKQSHTIMAPMTPVYNVKGKFICSLTNTALGQVSIKLMGEVKYNEEDTSKAVTFETTSDESGFFVLADVPGGNGYILTAEKEGYQTYAQNYVVYYTDKDVGEIVFEGTLGELHPPIPVIIRTVQGYVVPLQTYG